MSLVGTRPILQDELRQYELHHRARIAIKPGITGMWQVSGRSDITDLLSGGSGKRLWPLSNDIRSKQFIKIFKKEDGTYESMVQRVYRQIKKVDTDRCFGILVCPKIQ